MATSLEIGFLLATVCKGALVGTAGGRVASFKLFFPIEEGVGSEGSVLGGRAMVEVECCSKSSMKDSTAALTTTAASRDSTIDVC